MIMATRLAARTVLFQMGTVVLGILGGLRSVGNRPFVEMEFLIREKNAIISTNLAVQLAAKLMLVTTAPHPWVTLLSVGCVATGS